ncbi:helix-turn-helix domain-containing protein [Bacillus sp. SG-1]|uniref:helix-turn-helix domain-containing protein n=1 Tax=Bacillus sp. SG-1 TaxID=161544 RepID=UPI0001544E37|nr:helix-turn-helix domain-containing protein [Bacillus sp. SG-1]EDL63894.1 two-component hybrid sensor and regulator [Bacillus sp. SG-1]
MTKRTWLITLRKERKFTQQQIADKAFIDRSYYAQIEKGERKPSDDVAKKIANILEFHFSAFSMDENPFLFSLNNSPMILAHCDSRLKYTWIYNPHFDFDPCGVIGKTDTEIDDNEGTRAMELLKQDVLNQKAPIRRKICFPLSDGSIYYDVFAQPLLNEENLIIGVATSSTQMDESI